MILVWEVSSLSQTDSNDGMGFWENIHFVKIFILLKRNSIFMNNS